MVGRRESAKDKGAGLGEFEVADVEEGRRRYFLLSLVGSAISISDRKDWSSCSASSSRVRGFEGEGIVEDG